LNLSVATIPVTAGSSTSRVSIESKTGSLSSSADLELPARASSEAPPLLETPSVAASPHEPPLRDPAARLSPETDLNSPLAGGDLDFLAVTSTGWTPPDPHMAVGMNHLVVMTNGEIAFFDKLGTNLFRDEIEDAFGFWGGQGATNFVFDPEVVWDPYEDRFIAMACERSSTAGNPGYYLLAISDDDNPVGAWHKYRIDATPHAGDRPTIGNSRSSECVA
jgi:hypothetical protein